MEKCTENQIRNLQDNLLVIRKAGKWSAEQFGEMIGVTKQTISNLETKKTEMTKTQYIAIRAVLDYEMQQQPNNNTLISTVNLCLNLENLSEKDQVIAKKAIDDGKRNGWEQAIIIGGAAMLVGIVALKGATGAGKWLAKIIKQ